MKLIAWSDALTRENIQTLGADGYEKKFREIYGILKHPALYGFFIGDEPGKKIDFENSVECTRIQKKVAPELRPYINLHAGMDNTDPALLGGRTFREWLSYISKETGFSNFSYGHYDQVWNESGINSYYANIKALGEAADAAGVDMWNTQLSSAHYMFRIPSEYEFVWQITTAAACGSRGIIWFRFYDRSVGPNYHGSPIDEYGNKTEQYYKFLRANRRFQDQYGEIMMKLHHKVTYLTEKAYGGMKMFGTGTHPVLTDIRGTEQAVLGFFTDDDGIEYVAVVNGSMTNPGVFRIEFDHDKYNLDEATFNGTKFDPYNPKNTAEHWDGLWLYPGQMNLFRITKK